MHNNVLLSLRGLHGLACVLEVQDSVALLQLQHTNMSRLPQNFMKILPWLPRGRVQHIGLR